MEQSNQGQSPREIHEAAMVKYDEALHFHFTGDATKFAQLAKESLELEERAARMLSVDDEPTRSFLFKGAAFLARKIEQNTHALDLIEVGLQGNPPEYIKSELEHLKDEIISSQT